MKSSERVLLVIPKGVTSADFKQNAAFEKNAANIIGVRADLGNYIINGIKSITEDEKINVRVLLNPDSKIKQFDLPLDMFTFKQPSNILFLGLSMPQFSTEKSGVTIEKAFEEQRVIVFTFFFK
jgi:hypothetical protein